jgi:hypothetical protein
MKFDTIYKQAAFTFLKEQEESFEDPLQVSDEITSELPTPETIDLNEEKYKTLLLALKKALEMSVKDDLEKRKIISDIDVDNNPQNAEEQLISILNADTSKFPKAE